MKEISYYYGKDLEYPKSPIKPRLLNKEDLDEVIKYAEDLKKYKDDHAEYILKRKDYAVELNKRQAEFKADLIDSYSDFLKPVRKETVDIIYSECTEDTNSLSEVSENFDSMMEFLKNIGYLR